MKKLALASALVSAAFLTACSDDDDNVCDLGNNPTEFSGTVMNFSATAGSTPISCSANLTGLGTSGSDATVKAFAFYIHDVELTTDTGCTVSVDLEDNAWQNSGVALLDWQDKGDNCASDSDKPTNSMVQGDYMLPEGAEIASVSFKVGVPFSLNHEDSSAAPAPLNNQAMFWNWNAGYKFMRTDIMVTGASAWNFHLGSTGCEGDAQAGGITSCMNPNRPEITVSGFMPGDTINFDYANLVSGANVAENTPDTPPGCMSKPGDPECAPLFNNLGLDFGETTAQGEQSVFTLVNE